VGTPSRKIRHGCLLLAALCALTGLLIAAPGAVAGPSEDYAFVRQDYLANQGRTITPCRFTIIQLQNARLVASQNPEDSYNGFPEAIDREIARRNRGLCGRGLPTGTPTPGSRLGLSVSPRRVRRNHRATFTFTVTGRQGSTRIVVRGARVSFQGTRRTSDRNGRVRITKLFHSAGKRTATARLRGVKSATTQVTVRR
jgi:hypothetical protein